MKDRYRYKFFVIGTNGKIGFLGFTLIELLVVISIIGILASLALISYTRSQKQARDMRRKSDLRQYQAALENYANKNNGIYPLRTSATDVTGLCTTLEVGANCPGDPNTSNIYYYISSNGGDEFSLRASLESGSNTYWLVCSNGKSGETSTVPTSDNICPL